MEAVAPLVVITGPTASGKTRLAIELAQKYGGEIICADSRTIYKGMDVGTAKPTTEEQTAVPHHLLDVVDPGESFSAADFQLLANQSISDIRSRGKIPFLVGGTGLYIDAVVREYTWPKTNGSADELEGKSINELQTMIKKQHKAMPENALNKRHLISTLLRSEQGKALDIPRPNTYVVAIKTDKDILRMRIMDRAKDMFKTGVVDEATQLAKRFGWAGEAMTGNIYPIIRRVLDGDITEEQAIQEFATKDWQLAKRQITWLKRFSYIKWLRLDDAREYIETILG